jgi:hypothetical protein
MTELTDKISLRDYFAAKAMAALMDVYWSDCGLYNSGAELMICHVETAYEYADAMLAQRDVHGSKVND